MIPFTAFLNGLSSETISILDSAIPTSSYIPIDLSSENPHLKDVNIADPVACQRYIDVILHQKKGEVAYGGYLEKRNLYDDKSGFTAGKMRNVHLGIDFWAIAGTQVMVPLEGVVHSFQNNSSVGDYGPTIILKHDIRSNVFYTLYGHLSVDSLHDLYVGKPFAKGKTLAKLGTTDINVNYGPPLHFQIIRDLQANTGDYPGVAAENELHFYTKNCPNPNLLLNLKENH